MPSAGLAALAAVFAFVAFAGTASAVPGGAPAAARCANLTLNVGAPLGCIPVRFALAGKVTCAKAHSLARAYFRKLAARQCGQNNNVCGLDFPGGWSCLLLPGPLSHDGAMAGCAKQHGQFARVRFFNARTTPAPGAHSRLLRFATAWRSSASSRRPSW